MIDVETHKSAHGKTGRPRNDMAMAVAIGDRVKAKLGRIGASQRMLAKEIGVSNRTIIMIVAGRWCPSAATIVALCKALGMTPNEILGWDEK